MKLKTITFSLVLLPCALMSLCNYAYCQDKTIFNYYVGKQINVNPLDNTKRYIGYENFVLNIENPDDKKNIAFTSAKSLNSTYDSLVNKTFDCVDGGELPHYVNRQYLKLKGADNKIIYYIYYKNEEPLAISRIDDKQVGKVKIKKNQEVEYRTSLYFKKTYWLKDNMLCIFDESSNKYDIYSSNSLKFQSVTVTAVLPSPSTVNPYRLIIKTSTGKIGYIDFDDSEASNYDDMSFTPINTKKTYEKRQKLSEVLYLKNPIITYKLTPAQVAVIRKGDIYLGMSKKIITFIKGEPQRINTTTGSFGVHEQWVYGDNEYYYFENGKLTTVQN